MEYKEQKKRIYDIPGIRETVYLPPYLRGLKMSEVGATVVALRAPTRGIADRASWRRAVSWKRRSMKIDRIRTFEAEDLNMAAIEQDGGRWRRRRGRRGESGR